MSGFRKNELLNVFARKGATPDCRKWWIAKTVLMEIAHVPLQKGSITESVVEEMKHVRISVKETWKIWNERRNRNAGKIGFPYLLWLKLGKQQRISTSDGLETGHVQIPEKFNSHICWDWTGAHRIAEKGEFQKQFGRKLGMSAFQKRWISKSVVLEIGHTGIEKNWNAALVGVGMGHVRMPEKWIPTFVGIERGHTELQKRANFKNSLGRNRACQHCRKGELLNLLCWKLDTPELRKIIFPNLGGGNGACPDSRNQNSQIFWGWQGGTLDFLERWLKNQLGENWIYPHCQKGESPNLVWWNLGTPDVGKKWIFKSVCYESHLFPGVIGWLVADAHCKVYNYWILTARMDWLNQILWGKMRINSPSNLSKKSVEPDGPEWYETKPIYLHFWCKLLQIFAGLIEQVVLHSFWERTMLSLVSWISTHFGPVSVEKCFNLCHMLWLVSFVYFSEKIHRGTCHERSEPSLWTGCLTRLIHMCDLTHSYVT